jgi:hypothetical protein
MIGFILSKFWRFKSDTYNIYIHSTMAEDILNIYDEIEIDDMDFEEGKFYYPCPCGDKFQINIVSQT